MKITAIIYIAISLQCMTMVMPFVPTLSTSYIRPCCHDVCQQPSTNVASNRRAIMLMSAKTEGDEDDATTSTSTASTSSNTNTEPQLLYPVISKISGMEWTGSCRYISKELKPLTNLKLTGGTKYDVEYDVDGTVLTLSSFLTFPNGQTRYVIMKGEKKQSQEHEVMTLHPIDDEGPIIMKLSEIYPDTILINEIEKSTGNTIMTTSINIVQGAKGLELVGVSHEVGASEEVGGDVIEGHQLWRMTASNLPVYPSNDFDYRTATGW